MSIQLTNTLTGTKEEFLPLNPPHVSLYVCGVTVYDHCHIGHARGAVVFDVLRRYLESDRFKFKVTHVRNITDVDDKIIDRARAEVQTGSAPDLKSATTAVARRFEESFRSDFARLGLLPPTREPRATEYIPPMISFIADLIEKGMAYEGADGVYFPIREFSKSNKEYGKLSGQRMDQMLEGVRIDPGEGKKDPMDFALWKKAKPDEPSWESPWGPGRPGWHIECSTMSTDILGDAFDIHGGGQDLIFPHHENELAQSLGAGKKFANYWLHNGLLTVNGQKMSKSIGNIVTIGDALKRHPNPDVLRLFFLSAHYRSPIDFTWERFDEAAHAYERIATFLAHVSSILGETLTEDVEIARKDKGIQDYLMNGLGFYEAMEDDLNTPKALASIYHLVEIANEKFKIASGGGGGLTPREFKEWAATHGSKRIPELKNEQAHTCVLRDKILEVCQVLGFFQAQDFSPNDEVVRLVSQRDYARRTKDFTASDRIRQELTEMGYVVEDTAAGTVVRKRV